MEEFDYEKKKKRERYYIKFSLYTVLICLIIMLIWGFYEASYNVKILQYGEDAIGVITGKGYGKTTVKSPSPSYFIRFECVIESERYNMFEHVSKEAYDTVQIGQMYFIKYLPGKKPLSFPQNNYMILLNKPIKISNIE